MNAMPRSKWGTALITVIRVIAAGIWVAYLIAAIKHPDEWGNGGYIIGVLLTLLVAVPETLIRTRRGGNGTSKHTS